MQIAKKGNRKAIFSAHKRAGISPVLATVILIAITLIAAIAIAGFVFGLFGSFTSTAQVSGSVLSCTAGVCNVSLHNTGSANAAVTACSLTIGTTLQGVDVGGTWATALNAGATQNYACDVSGATNYNAPVVGAQAVGTFSMSNGGTVSFSGTWS